MSQFNSPISERHLEDKSKLVFQFSIDEEPRVKIKTLNFMENIQINEKVVANYAQYTPIGSNGSTFAYLGSKSREFDISFNITLPHIMESTLIKPEVTNPTPSKAELQQSFFLTSTDLLLQEIASPNNYKSFIKHVDRQHQDLLTEKDIRIEDSGSDGGIGFGFPRDTLRQEALVKVMHWVNLIRASCLNHSKKPYLGPPLVRLFHGILYTDVPCLVNSYNITYDQMNGFDAKTMLPRVISVKLTLKEVRLRGREFSPGSDGDYMPGWDSMFVDNDFVTLDPTIPGWAN